MGTKASRNIELTDNLTLSECKNGYWLYDYTRGMNLSMKAKTEADAFTEAITYYQKRTKKLEDELKVLKNVKDYNYLKRGLEILISEVDSDKNSVIDGIMQESDSERLLEAFQQYQKDNARWLKGLTKNAIAKKFLASNSV